jgi:predicted nucleic acid-binding protein
MTDSIKFFLDTNLVVYAMTEQSGKADIANQLLRKSATLSAQVVNEASNVLSVKYKFSFSDVSTIALDLLELCDVVPVSDKTIRKAIDLRQRFSLSHWDSLIVAAACLAGCEILYSEDLQDGLSVDGTIIKNPFC